MTSDENDSLRRREASRQTWQSTLMALGVAAICWFGKVQWDRNAQEAEVAEQIKNLSANVSELKGAIVAMQSSYVTRPEFAVHEQRIERLEVERRAGR